eukprot:4764927-Amphidinium_carterae.1
MLDPSLLTPHAARDAPTLAKLLTDKLAPSCWKPKTDAQDPIMLLPQTATDEPSRAKFRSDRLAPRCK